MAQIILVAGGVLVSVSVIVVFAPLVVSAVA